MPPLVLAGGLVVDPGQQMHEIADVVIEGDRVSGVGVGLSQQSPGYEILDVTGYIVTPGLVDLHTHLYHGVSALGLDADRVCLPAGVTTAVDAGTAGAITFPGFRDYCIAPARTRILAFVNLSSVGLIVDDGHELDDMRYVDEEALAAVVDAHRGLCVGIKVRVGKLMVKDLHTRALDSAVRMGERLGVPVMVHISNPGVPLADVFSRLRAGDIVTHVLHGRGETIVAGGRLLPSLREAMNRGVVTDVGHGKGSFAFSTARAALAAGFVPHTISTDLHAFSVERPVVDMPTTMSKFLALGMPLDDVVAASTVRPARALGLATEIGTLGLGMRGDVAVFNIIRDPTTLVDSHGETLAAAQRIVPVMTVKAGEVVRPLGSDRRGDAEVSK